MLYIRWSKNHHEMTKLVALPYNNEYRNAPIDVYLFSFVHAFFSGPVAFNLHSILTVFKAFS